MRQLAGRSGLQFIAGGALVREEAERRAENLEQMARDLRYGFFRELIEAGKLNKVALGHTRSDQAETVLFRLLRGSGTAGLAGIHPVTREGFVRPLLEAGRPEIEDYLRGIGAEWREDASNADPRFDRNRIRHELLPALQREWNPELSNTLARMAAVARDEEAYWEDEINRLAPGLLTEGRGAVVLDAAKARRLPVAVLRRLLRRAVARAKGDLRGTGVDHVERLLELLRHGSGEGRVELPGLVAVRSFDWIRFAKKGAAAGPSEFAVPAAPPARVPLPGSNSVIYLELVNNYDPGKDPNTGYTSGGGGALDWRKLTGPLEVRSWRPGDQIQPIGRVKAHKLKILFQKARVPSWDRPGWPILTDRANVVWTRQFGVAEDYAAEAGCPRALRVWEEPAKQTG